MSESGKNDCSKSKSSDDGVGGKQSRKSRLALLENSLEKAKQKCISRWTFKQFSRALPDYCKHNPEGFKMLVTQLQANLSHNVEEEWKLIISEENLPSLLENLEDMCAKETGETLFQPAWRPSGQPELDVKAHLYNAKLEVRSKLVSVLEKRRQESMRLSVMLNKRREQTQNLQRVVNAKFELCTEAANACDETVLRKFPTLENQPNLCAAKYRQTSDKSHLA